jgi:quinol monooxygenase YgiN
MFVVTKHRVAQADLSAWLSQARASLQPLAQRPGCLGLHVGLATDEPDLVAIVSVWESVGAYRKAMSSYEVKALSIPLLSTSQDESSAFENVLSLIDGELVGFEPARAWDADSIGLGEAAAADVRHRLDPS